ncbi:uncharacterized protein BDV17DRAFT_7146 [Aspergillus undulatus]|uniref:uncharacterized protein n=1 Tax=Aspergillus undulatus TaxID=1810928 RepID=UPI003CCE3B60
MRKQREVRTKTKIPAEAKRKLIWIDSMTRETWDREIFEEARRESEEEAEQVSKLQRWGKQGTWKKKAEKEIYQKTGKSCFSSLTPPDQKLKRMKEIACYSGVAFCTPFSRIISGKRVFRDLGRLQRNPQMGRGPYLNLGSPGSSGVSAGRAKLTFLEARELNSGPAIGFIIRQNCRPSISESKLIVR